MKAQKQIQRMTSLGSNLGSGAGSQVRIGMSIFVWYPILFLVHDCIAGSPAKWKQLVAQGQSLLMSTERTEPPFSPRSTYATFHRLLDNMAKMQEDRGGKEKPPHKISRGLMQSLNSLKQKAYMMLPSSDLAAPATGEASSGVERGGVTCGSKFDPGILGWIWSPDATP